MCKWSCSDVTRQATKFLRYNWLRDTSIKTPISVSSGCVSALQQQQQQQHHHHPCPREAKSSHHHRYPLVSCKASLWTLSQQSLRFKATLSSRYTVSLSVSCWSFSLLASVYRLLHNLHNTVDNWQNPAIYLAKPERPPKCCLDRQLARI